MLFRSLSLLLLASCAEVSDVRAYFLRTDFACARAQGTNVTAEFVAKTFPSQVKVVTETFYVSDVCSTDGGDYVLARASAKQLFMGGLGCESWDDPPEAPYAVAVYTPTAGTLTVPRDACVAFPDKAASDVQTDSVLEALVAFSTRAAAERFLSDVTAFTP